MFLSSTSDVFLSQCVGEPLESRWRAVGEPVGIFRRLVVENVRGTCEGKEIVVQNIFNQLAVTKPLLR